jgi:hypothetical protein
MGWRGIKGVEKADRSFSEDRRQKAGGWRLEAGGCIREGDSDPS